MLQDSPVYKIVLTLFSFFLVDQVLASQRSRLRKSHFVGEANSIVGQLLVTHLLYTVQDLFSAA